MNTLHTPRLTLLPQCAAHADAMFAVLGDPAIYAYENEAPASVEWLRDRFARLESRRSADGSEHWLNWVVRPVDDAALIGYLQATVQVGGPAYIAYVFGSAHWGRGLASEATAAVLDELVAHYGVTEFLAVLKRDNRRSSRLLERLGFAPASAAALAAHPVEPDEMLMTCRLDRQSCMSTPTIDLSPLRRALALLDEALVFWADQPDGAPLKPHLRSAVIQSFEFSYELSVRLLRRVLIERSESAERITDLSFNDLFRGAADAGLVPDPSQWREWREMRNATSHAYNESRAQAVALRAGAFAVDAAALLRALEASLAN